MTRQTARKSPDAAGSASPNRVAARQRTRRRLRMVPLLLLAMALGLVWFVPQIVARTALKQRLLAAALPEFEGRLRIGDLRLGWLSPVEASSVELTDPDNQPLLHAPLIQTEKSLLGLLCRPRTPGRIAIDQPQLRLALRARGSNLEDTLAPFRSAPAHGTARLEISLEIRRGVVEALQTETGQRFNLQQLDADVTVPSDASQPVTVHISAQVEVPQSPPGTVSAELRWSADPATADPTLAEIEPVEPEAAGPGMGGGLGQGQVTWKAEAIPLEILQTLALRLGAEARVRGSGASEGSLQWTENGQRCLLQLDRLTATDVAVRAEKWPEQETLATPSLDASGRIERQGPAWQAQDLTIQTNFARLAGSGRLAWRDGNARQSWEAWLNQLAQESQQLEGEVDLVQLAQMLPGTLHLRQLRSGAVRFSLASRAAPAPGWVARLETDRLAAADQQRELPPIRCVASLHASPEGPVIEQLTCESSFLAVAGSGTLPQGSATVRGNLRRFAEEFGQVLDLGDCQLAGQLDGQLKWQRDQADRVSATGELTLRDFELAAANRLPWREPQLVVRLAAAAQMPGTQIEQVTSATVRLEAGDDQLQLELLQPVPDPGAAAAWPVGCQLKGNVASWLPRLQPVFRVTGWQASGTLDATATVLLSSDKVDAQAVRVTCQPLKIEQQPVGDTGALVTVEDPSFQLETAVFWDRKLQQVVLTNATLTSSIVQAQADQLAVKWSERGLPVEGAVSFEGDVARLTRCYRDPRRPIERQLFGKLAGAARVRHQGDVTVLTWSGKVEDLVCAAPRPDASGQYRWERLWSRPELAWSGQQTYDQTRDRLELAELSLNSGTLQLRAKGLIDQLTTRCVADVSGQIAYDWQELSELLQPHLSAGFQLTGQDTSTFALRGPLFGVRGASDVPDPAQARLRQASGGALARRLDGDVPHPTQARLRITPVANRGAEAGPETPPSAGPFVPPELTAEAGLRWTAGQLYGLSLGPGQLQAQLADSRLQVQPLDLRVGEGRLKAAPWIDFTTRSPLVRVDPGQVIENVRISPELCRTWLKYIAPLLADATQAEGRFSISLAGAAVPVDDLHRADVHGQLAVHTARVGPGPLAQKFLTLAQEIRGLVAVQAGNAGDPLTGAWLSVPEQAVRFDVTEGRVHHQGLTMHVQDVTIRTSGSVGLDQSLALTAEIPIRDEWLASRPVLGTLKGTVLKIPVEGSFSKPQLDAQVLREFGRQMLRGTAGKMLEDQLQRGLERLLPPRP